MDLIDRQSAIEACLRYNGVGWVWSQILDEIKEIPSADIDLSGFSDKLWKTAYERGKAVRHGHWDTVEDWDGDEHYKCSECGAEFVLIDGTPEDNDYLYCPHCGALMDERSE